MTMLLYGFWRSIASYRVRVALRLKDLAFEERSINLLGGEQFSPAYEAVNAAHAVPVLEDIGLTIRQSLAIIEYLEGRFPSPALLPELLADRAYVRALALDTIADAHPLLVPRVRKQLAERFSVDAAGTEDWGRHWLSVGLSQYEQALSRRPPAPFVMGEEPGLADICIMSHLVAADLFHAPLSRTPQLQKLRESCEELEAFSASHPLKQPGAPSA